MYLSPVDKKYETFNNLLTYYFEIAFQKKIIKKVLRKSWITNDLKEEKSKIIHLSKQVRKNGQDNQKLKEKLSGYKKRLIESKKLFYDTEIANSCNVAKTVWRVISSEEGNKNTNVNSKNVIVKKDNIFFSNPDDVSNIFNNYFTSVVELTSQCNLRGNSNTNTAGNVNMLSESYFIKPLFNFKFVTAEQVESVINSLKNKHSSGVDELPLSP